MINFNEINSIIFNWEKNDVKKIGSILVIILAAIVFGGYFYLRSSLPVINGKIDVAGIQENVEIFRDEEGIPHIFAETVPDAYFGLGFVHAQDRLWQMELMRRAGAGRLAEIFGEGAVPRDRFMRTMGIYESTATTYDLLNPQYRELLDAYTGGVNGWLDAHTNTLPLEFKLIGHVPEPWHPFDSLYFMKLMTLTLSYNWEVELLRAALLQRLTEEQVWDLWPPYPEDGHAILSKIANIYNELPLTELLSAIPDEYIHQSASNNWVVDGTHSITGKPLLANDPHLAIELPLIWHLVRLHAPGFDVRGVSSPGSPFISLGQTPHAAWALTNGGVDVQDLFIEKVDPHDPARYLTPEGSKPFKTRKETIRVKGAEDVHFAVRSTRHGPVISDLLELASEVAGEQHVLALAATNLGDNDLSSQVFFKLNFLESWDGFLDAGDDFLALHLNMVYADEEENIGYYGPAQRIPIRKRGNGTVPVPGWTGEYDWSGFIPMEEMPISLNPASGRIVTANAKIVSDSYPYFLTYDWREEFRQKRADELLTSKEKHSKESFREIQGDVLSLGAKQILQAMLTGIEQPQDPRGAEAVELLTDWDFRMDKDKPEPLIYYAWWRAAYRSIFADELGDLFSEYVRANRKPDAGVFRSVLSEKEAWCDDITTAERESCRAKLAESLSDALVYLSERYGDRMDRWTWGEAHKARFTNKVLTRVPLIQNFSDFVLMTPEGDVVTPKAMIVCCFANVFPSINRAT